MINYDFTISAYEEFLKQKGGSEQENAFVGGKLAALRLLNGRSEDEVYELFNTGAFNDIVYTYVKGAVGNAGLSEYTSQVLDELKFLFDAVGAKEICEASKNAEN